MTKAEIAEYLADTKLRAAEILVEYGNHEPLVFLFPPADVPEPPAIFRIGRYMGSVEGKNDITNRIRNAVLQARASGVVTILEAWVSPAAVAGWGLRPSEDPDRREVLKITWEFRAEDAEEKVAGATYQFFHHEGEDVVLDEALDVDGLSEVGRFANFLD